MSFNCIDVNTAEYIFKTIKDTVAKTKSEFIYEGPSVHKYIKDISFGKRISGMFSPYETKDQAICLDIISFIKISIEQFIEKTTDKKYVLNNLVYSKIINESKFNIEDIILNSNNNEFIEDFKSNNFYAILILNDPENINSLKFNEKNINTQSGKLLIGEFKNTLINVGDYSKEGFNFILFGFTLN